MSEVNTGSHGDLACSSEALALGAALHAGDPSQWVEHANSGLLLAVPVYKNPDMAPLFYEYLGSQSEALGLACRSFDTSQTLMAKGNAVSQAGAARRILGMNFLAVALTEDEAVSSALRNIRDPYAFEEHLPTAVAVLAQDEPVRKQVVDLMEVQGHPMRGVTLGLRGTWRKAVDAAIKPAAPSNTALLEYQRHMSNELAVVSDGKDIANGATVLRLIVATYIDATNITTIRSASEAKPETSNPVYFDSDAWRSAIPTDLHELLGMKRHEMLGISIPEARDIAAGNNQAALEKLRADIPVIDMIREDITTRGITYVGSNTAEGMTDGGNTVALAFANTTSRRLTEVLRSLDLVSPAILRASLNAAWEKAETVVAEMRNENQDLSRGMAALDLPRTALLLSSLCGAVNIDARRYADPSKGKQEENKFFGYLTGAYAHIKTIAELHERIPAPPQAEAAA